MGEEGTHAGAEAVRRYRVVVIECQQRALAIAELERLLPVLPDVTAALARILEAVVTFEQETFVQRVRESRELEHLRARLVRLGAMATTH